MVIGLLSMQRVINYGSYLQAYALKKTIECLGYEVRFVDIIPGTNVGFVLADPTAKKPKIDRYIIKRIEHVIFSKKRRTLYCKELHPSIGINEPIEMEKCDMIVIGSDEVFNCVQPTIGFSPSLLGATGKNTISYAASCGYTTFDIVKKIGLDNELKECLDNFNHISVRDNNTYNFVKMLTHKEPFTHLDPVLIYDWDKIVKKQNKFKNYILVYAYDNRINDPEEIRAIKDFAKTKNEKIISFGLYQRWCDKNILCDPFELISYFDSAEYIITDTFHGTVISIKRNKKFATIIRKSNKEKLNDLLAKFNLLDRRIDDLNNLEKIIDKDIDYEQVNRCINDEKKKSIHYLKENLANDWH